MALYTNIKVSNPNVFKNISNALKAADGTQVSAGLFKPDSAHKAVKHNLGIAEDDLPRRPFLDQAEIEIETNGRIRDVVTQHVTTHINNPDKGAGHQKDLQKAVGEIMVEEIREAIDRQDFEPLTEATLELRRSKGNYSDKILVETGQMYKDVEWKAGDANFISLTANLPPEFELPTDFNDPTLPF